MTEYEKLIRDAEEEAATGRYKEAYNTLGRAVRIGGTADWECRYRRGVCALRVAQTRMDAFDDTPSVVALSKVACWLSRSQAYLMSATEDASGEKLDQIAHHVAEVEKQQERFRRVWKGARAEEVLTGQETTGGE